eukprot:CAMPEP_0172361326 /NCGR_PEP_ID=MMETSP1060-20121228/5177_1 /TAXON_ID=37318 /ORGANISM="Pseudo-nitzschia pungens, Strain cf. cingulata" /LENGTH=95 /DNA_ID=CAMNT_0013083555 /DNA_START=223 /DNA_END=510 /DNA_ORIENTATION=+
MFHKILQGIATWLPQPQPQQLANKDLEEKVKELQKALEQKEATNNLEEKVKELQKALEKKAVELEREGFQNLRVGDVKPFDGTQANWIKWKNEAK